MRRLLIAVIGMILLAALAVPAFASSPQVVFPGNPSLSSLTTTNDCTLTVPANPTTAEGLSTPYVLGSGNDGTVCAENDQGTAAFVQAVIYSPNTRQIWTYNPAVRTAGQPLLGTPPPFPHFPDGSIVTIWTGFNDNILKLIGPGAGQFTNFAQQSYDGSPRWFGIVYAAAFRGQIHVPPLGTSPVDHEACPAIRSWDVVDQDQSDNVPVTYPAYGVSNGSDDQLIQNIDQALQCTQWLVPSLSQPGTTTTAGPLDEVQAQIMMAQPQALVPAGDEFTTTNGNFLAPIGTGDPFPGLPAGQPDLFFRDLYRSDVGQQPTFDNNDTRAYCENLYHIGAPKLVKDAPTEANFPAPSFAQLAPTLAGVLTVRFDATWTNLNCTPLTGLAQPNS
jgi:hypothetical protein